MRFLMSKLRPRMTNQTSESAISTSIKANLISTVCSTARRLRPRSRHPSFKIKRTWMLCLTVRCQLQANQPPRFKASQTSTPCSTHLRPRPRHRAPPKPHRRRKPSPNLRQNPQSQGPPLINPPSTPCLAEEALGSGRFVSSAHILKEPIGPLRTQSSHESEDTPHAYSRPLFPSCHR